jgi:hypothetical protein
MFERLPEFDRRSPIGLKRFARAFFEIKFRPDGGYVRNYDVNNTPVRMLQFLVERGRVAPTEMLTDEQIANRYQSYLARALAAMHADEGIAY